MKIEELEQVITSSLSVAGDNLQSHGGFCIQFNFKNEEDFCSSILSVAQAINNVADSLDKIAYAKRR